MCHCLVDLSVVNHAIDEWRRRVMSAAYVDAEGGHFEQSSDCYSQNNNVEIAAL